MNSDVRPLTKEEFEDLIIKLREARPDIASYFGVEGCDLTSNEWWGAYIRQSLEEQSRNNRIPEYLLTSAQEAKTLGVVIPFEYIWYDAETSQHMDRKVFRNIRQNYIKGKRITGLVIPALDRLSRISSHIEEFERRADHASVRYWYGDAPNGTDPTSKLIRQNMAMMANWVLISNRKNNLGGRIGALYNNKVPTGPAPLGFKYMASKREWRGQNKTIESWYELDGLREEYRESLSKLGPRLNVCCLESREDLTLYFTENSPAYIVALIFYLCVNERWSSTKIAHYLNENKILSPRGKGWWDATVLNILKNTIYFGKGRFNTRKKAPNPKHDLPDDITAKVPKTVLRPKPETEWHYFSAPAIIDEDTWERAQRRIEDNRTWRGASQPLAPMLLRGHIYCPACGKLMRAEAYLKGRHVGQDYYKCSVTKGRVRACSFNKGINAKKAEAAARRCLKAYLQHPECLMEAATSLFQDEMEGGGAKAQADYWQNKVKDAEATIKRTQHRADIGFYTDEEAAVIIQGERQKLKDAKEAAERAARSIEEREQVFSTIQQMAEMLSNDVEMNLDDYDTCRWLLDLFGCGFVPFPDGSGEGELYLFASTPGNFPVPSNERTCACNDGRGA